MTTLFSPIGSADPISNTGDGPMLHIVRHYKPERVILFLSPKMTVYQLRDERYTKAIELLCKSENTAIPRIQVIKSKYDDVFRFDHYIEEFDKALSELCDSGLDDPILLNSTSGTPGMQQAIVALGSFGHVPMKVLQVTSPRKDANKKNDRPDLDTYDLDYMWEWNEILRDEKPDARESRIIEVEAPNFAERLLRENITSLIQRYDYEGAYELACKSSGIDKSTRQMIRAARDRLNLYSILPEKVFKNTGLDYQRNDLLGEYLAVMSVRLEQGHWADFMRMLTPAYTQLAKDILKKYGLTEDRYLVLVNGEEYLNWDAIQSNPHLRHNFGDSQGNRLTNWMLTNLIRSYCMDKDVRIKLFKLRKAEENCRHKVAHELQTSDKETLERLSGLKLETIMRYLFDLHGKAHPRLYAQISQAITEQL